MAVYQPTYLHETVKVGEGTRIGAFCDIGRDVKIGRNCNIQAHVTISNQCYIGDNVFIGPNTSLLNDKYMNNNILPVIIEDHAKIGGGCVILPGVRIGEYAVVGAGSVVTKHVKPRRMVYGNPAKTRRRGKRLKLV